VVAAASPALAREPAVGADRDTEVAQLVERGIELRRLGQDAQALLLFEAALERAPESARVRVHVAMTHQALGQWIEADRYLRQLMLESADPYVRKHEAAIESARQFVDRHVGSFELTGDPAGAEIRLSGRRIGTLPLPEPVRLPVGSYVLEVHNPGHYSVVRPITLRGGVLVRESVSLAAREQLAPAPVAAGTDAPGADETRSPRWLTWTLAGGGAAAALSAGVAVLVRESHARRWNDPQCLAPDMTRGQVCGDDLDAGRSAETVALASGVVSGVFLAAALASYLLEAPASEAGAEEAGVQQSASRSTAAAALRCGVGWASAACAGTF
jgi:hypothetical protein